MFFRIKKGAFRIIAGANHKMTSAFSVTGCQICRKHVKTIE